MGELFQARLRRFEELEQLLSDPKVLTDSRQVKVYAKEMAALKPLADRNRECRRLKDQIRTTQELLDSKETQPDMRTLALCEMEELKARLEALEREMEGMLLEEDPEEARNVIVEIRAGTGGSEASLFAADLYRMYSRFAARRSWRVEPLGSSPSEVGGVKEVIFAVEGEDVFRWLRFERGVHRVQRVPVTEASGRIHTSTVTVAVLPQAEEVEVQLDPKDLRIDVFRSSGPGGQSVNTADSAVRITHLPTGVVVSCQDERSQLKNKAKGMKVLRARLLELKSQEQAAQRTQERRSQIGTGDRSEKIRTYNFPDRRVTDHRINFTSHRLEDLLNGEMEDLLNPLLEADRQAKLGERR
ncbi:MAG: peptide chain release factor 1 [Candidatus Omnitrophica bacterium]|nr:peptide chain release factor 1 [Candidatus Omnitrophota bacterium]